MKIMSRLVIDSASRNHSLYPNPDHYVVHLDQTIKGVRSLFVTFTDFLFSAYTISDGNDVLTVQLDTDHPVDLRMTHGNYDTVGDLLNMAQQVLDSQIPAAVITIHVDSRGFIYMESPSTFRILPSRLSSAHEVFGFSNSTHNSIGQSLSYSITANSTPNLTGERYLCLHTSIAGGIQSPMFGAYDALATISPCRHEIINPHVVHMGRAQDIAHIEVTVVRANGCRYDFQGKDHLFELIMNP